VPADPQRATGWAVAVMELGALVCTARAPRCADCPLSPQCRWHAAGCPAPAGPAQRGQAWHGTDRQIRGRLLAVLREAGGALPRAALAAVVPDATPQEVTQRDRCLDSLVADGLVEPLDGDLFALPGLHQALDVAAVGATVKA
ncbi:MAG TPA: hypothetical protein VES36_03595, partial [Candidatus Limnocylindrales bacterium]|nr:hypothetical protein [Candidatus Limnocylindrales bacterium]